MKYGSGYRELLRADYTSRERTVPQFLVIVSAGCQFGGIQKNDVLLRVELLHRGGFGNYLHHGPGSTCTEHYWQASYQAPPTATGERSREVITGVSARLSNEDENEWQDYSVANSGAA